MPKPIPKPAGPRRSCDGRVPIPGGATVTQSAMAQACGVDEGTASGSGVGRDRWAVGRMWTERGAHRVKSGRSARRLRGSDWS